MPECKSCQTTYDIKEIHRNYGSDHNNMCWPCLQGRRAGYERDPYRSGVAFLRNEPLDLVGQDLVDRYKQAFELTQRMLTPQTSEAPEDQ